MVAVNFKNDCFQYSFILTPATQKPKISKTINLRLIVWRALVYSCALREQTEQFKLRTEVFPALFLDFLALKKGTDRLSRNVGTELSLYAMQNPRRAQILFTLQWKPEIKLDM